MSPWWVPLILRDLRPGVVTFDDLVADLGLSHSLLASRLETMLEDGLVERRVYGPRTDRYRVTAAPLTPVRGPGARAVRGTAVLAGGRLPGGLGATGS